MQNNSFILDSASRHALITQADLLKFYPTANIRLTKEKVIGANLQPLQFIGMTTIPIINGSGDAVQCDFLVQKKGFTLLGVRAMRKLGITISFRKVKEEPKYPEPIFPSAYRYDNQDSAKFPRSNSLSRHAVMVPPCNTSHTFFMSSLKPGCQHKTKKKCLEYFKRERSKTSKMRASNDEFYEMGRVRIKRRLYPEKYPRPSQKGRSTTRRRHKNPETLEENHRAAQEEGNYKFLIPPFIIHSPNISNTHHSMST